MRKYCVLILLIILLLIMLGMLSHCIKKSCESNQTIKKWDLISAGVKKCRGNMNCIKGIFYAHDEEKELNSIVKSCQAKAAELNIVAKQMENHLNEKKDYSQIVWNNKL